MQNMQLENYLMSQCPAGVENDVRNCPLVYVTARMCGMAGPFERLKRNARTKGFCLCMRDLRLLQAYLSMSGQSNTDNTIYLETIWLKLHPLKLFRAMLEDATVQSPFNFCESFL
jgi:hypothetical protein